MARSSACMQGVCHHAKVNVPWAGKLLLVVTSGAKVPRLGLSHLLIVKISTHSTRFFGAQDFS